MRAIVSRFASTAIHALRRERGKHALAQITPVLRTECDIVIIAALLKKWMGAIRCAI